MEVGIDPDADETITLTEQHPDDAVYSEDEPSIDVGGGSLTIEEILAEAQRFAHDHGR